MNYLSFLLAVVFLSFTACDRDDIRKAPAGGNETFIVGHVGGWFGTKAFKLENGTLWVSADQAGVEMVPENIVNDLAWEPFGGEPERNRIEALAADFPADLFTDERQSTACTVAAVDGQCPFVITVDDKADIRVWTWDSPSTTGPSDVYMRGLSNVIYDLLD